MVESQPTRDNGDVFVGRQTEMAELTATLDAALTGQGCLIMLAGEPGIGKTRTAQELAALAEERGAQVLWGRCYEEAYTSKVNVVSDLGGGITDFEEAWTSRVNVASDLGGGITDFEEAWTVKVRLNHNQNEQANIFPEVEL